MSQFVRFGRVTSVYNTHRPLLGLALEVTSGPILELGCGDGSTPLLRAYAEETRRTFVSYDDHPQWAAEYGSLFVADWDQVPLEETKWSVALVDHAGPEPGRRRGLECWRLRYNCEIVVAHDTEVGQKDGYEAAFRSFRYRLDDKRWIAWTSLLSNYHDVRAFPLPDAISPVMPLPSGRNIKG